MIKQITFVLPSCPCGNYMETWTEEAFYFFSSHYPSVISSSLVFLLWFYSWTWLYISNFNSCFLVSCSNWLFLALLVLLSVIYALSFEIYHALKTPLEYSLWGWSNYNFRSSEFNMRKFHGDLNWRGILVVISPSFVPWPPNLCFSVLLLSFVI